MDSNLAFARVSKNLLSRMFITISLTIASSFAELPKDWVFVGSESPPESINAVAADGAGTFVAVGDNGVVYWSPNGDDWFFRPVRGIDGDVGDVIYQDGQWILVTSLGEVGTSENGRVWDMQVVEDASFSKAVSFGGVFYAIGEGSMGVSVDGKSWALSENPVVANFGEIVEATVVSGKLAVVSSRVIDSLRSEITVYSSSDGSVWQQSATDLSVWTGSEYSFAGIDGLAVITYNYFQLYASLDLVNWEHVWDPTQEAADLGSANSMERTFALNGRIVIFVRQYETIEGGRRPTGFGSYVSLGADATFRDEIFVNPIDKGFRGGFPLTEPAFVAGDRIFVASDLGSLYSSEDLVGWTKHFEGRTDDFVGIAASDDRIVAVTEFGDVVTSDNAFAWTLREGIGEGTALDIKFGNGNFLVGSGELESYLLRSFPYYRVKYDRLSYSNDGEVWRTVNVGFDSDGIFSDPSPAAFHSFASGNGTTLAISIEGEIYRSIDFENWKKLPYSFPSAEYICTACTGFTAQIRIDIEMYSHQGEFWVRSVEVNGEFGIYSDSYSEWYRSEDNGATWSFESNESPSFIDQSLLNVLPRRVINRVESLSSENIISGAVYVFGRYVRVGEDYRIELSETTDEADHTRLVNLSVRAFAGEGDSTLIAGFVTTVPDGEAEGQVLLRGVGPSIAEVVPGLTDQLAADPHMFLFKGKDLIDENEDNAIENASSVFDSVGAFQLMADSADATLLREFEGGLFTTHITDAEGGIALAEIYRMPESGIELVNLSGRAFVSGGDLTFIGGFVLAGETVRTILIRGVGPGMGIGGELPDPMIQLYKGSEIIASNDDWSGVSLGEFFEAAGAFDLEEGSKDAAMVLPLLPGLYTVHLVAKEGESGIALLEIYDLGD